MGEIDPSFGQLTMLQHLYVLRSIVLKFVPQLKYLLTDDFNL